MILCRFLNMNNCIPSLSMLSLYIRTCSLNQNLLMSTRCFFKLPFHSFPVTRLWSRSCLLRITDLLAMITTDQLQANQKADENRILLLKLKISGALKRNSKKGLVSIKQTDEIKNVLDTYSTVSKCTLLIERFLNCTDF